MVLLLLCLLLLIIVLIESNAPPFYCADPDVPSTINNLDRKFLLIGSDNSAGAGIGNFLIFYPSAFWFAAFTGRNLIISDNSTIGDMCKIIQCGFPFASDLRLAFPSILNVLALSKVEDVKSIDFIRYIEGTRDISANVVRASGYMASSDWWSYINHTTYCVKKITGCDLGDVSCADRYAYQRLVRGPFKTSLTDKEEKRIYGVPAHIKHAILTLPHAYAPRLDAAIHIRAQFHHFEQQADVNNPEYKKEVNEWLNSSECQLVFEALETKVIQHTLETRNLTEANDIYMKNNPLALSNSNNSNTNTSIEVKHINSEPIYIYLAGDNEDVKDAFAHAIESKYKHILLNLMRVETSGVVHAKNMAKMKQLSDNEGVMDLIFDWYALTLANHIFAWRKGGTTMLSTFVHSAQRVSGSTARTRVRNPVGTGGFGSIGFTYQKNKRGSYNWDYFWSYGFLEDYRIEGD